MERACADLRHSGRTGKTEQGQETCLAADRLAGTDNARVMLYDLLQPWLFDKSLS